MKNAIILSMELSIRYSGGISGDQAPTFIGLKRYISKVAYDIVEDSILLVWVVPNNLKATFDN